MTYIPTAFALQAAAKESIKEQEVAERASFIIKNGNLMDEEILKDYLAEFAVHLTAVVTQNVSQIFMTEDQIAEMLNEVLMFEQIGKDISEE